MNNDLHAVLALGDPQEVAALVVAGADIHFRTESGYDALLTAVYGRDVFSDPRLLDLLTLLIDCGVSLTGKSTYNESAVRVLSRIGRFDAVHLLLQAGADPADLENTALIKAVAFGSLADVEAAAGESADLEARDYWERTAWLVAIQTGAQPCQGVSSLSRSFLRAAMAQQRLCGAVNKALGRRSNDGRPCSVVGTRSPCLSPLSATLSERHQPNRSKRHQPTGNKPFQTEWKWTLPYREIT